MSGVSELAYIGAGTTDLGAWRSYGTEVLGHEVTSDSDDHAVYLRCDDRHHRLLAVPGKVDDVEFVGWQARSPEALDALSSAVSNAGVEIHEATSAELALRRVLGMSWFICPHSGVRMELVYGHQVIGPTFRPTRALEGFNTGNGGLGHAVLYAKDVQLAARFYSEILGFGVSDFATIPGVGPIGAFLHCNERHHSLAFFGFDSPPRKMHHVMFETKGIDDVGFTYDICLDRSITTTSLGRHGNDWSFSFYFRNPSQWHIEYSWSPRVVNPETWITEQYTFGNPGRAWGHAGLREMH